MRRVLPAQDDPHALPPAAAATAEPANGRTLCVGLGCTRGAAPEDVAAAAHAMLAEAGLATHSVLLVATARRKQDEPALRQWAGAIGAGFTAVDDAILDAQPIATPSDRVQEKIGLKSVAEAAALAAANASRLLLTRRTAALPNGHYLTLAVAVAR